MSTLSRNLCRLLQQVLPGRCFPSMWTRIKSVKANSVVCKHSNQFLNCRFGALMCDAWVADVWCNRVLMCDAWVADVWCNRVMMCDVWGEVGLRWSWLYVRHQLYFSQTDRYWWQENNAINTNITTNNRSIDQPTNQPINQSSKLIYILPHVASGKTCNLKPGIIASHNNQTIDLSVQNHKETIFCWKSVVFYWWNSNKDSSTVTVIITDDQFSESMTTIVVDINHCTKRITIIKYNNKCIKYFMQY